MHEGKRRTIRRCKAVERGMVITNACALEEHGGKSGEGASLILYWRQY